MKALWPRSILLAALLAAGQAVASGPPADLAERRAETRGEVERLTREMTVSDERQKQLAREVAAIRKDNASLTAALIQAAKTEKKLSEDISGMEDKLAALAVDRDRVRQSLVGRRGVLAEVLGALQRMGLNPPPAILVRPDDALASVRSAILLGAVVPELRQQTALLVADLDQLARLGKSIELERERLFGTAREQAAEQRRLSLLLEEKRRVQANFEQSLAAERTRAADLAKKAGSLKDLIAALDADIRKAEREAEKARIAEERRLQREQRAARAPVPGAHALTGQAPFAALKGALTMPVSGRILRRFGEADAAGIQGWGDTVTTQSGAIVTAPSDGTVLYAGPFRSYGQLLIVDAGDGYHVVLSGLGRVNVSPGQSVLAGEPVGAMGEARVASAAAEGEMAQPELYIEFRKDQKPVDPAPWWQVRPDGRTNHDS